ncbi:potassium-tellurite ethidium and proflavin transporter [Burkholderia sp. Ac-20345]|uniref:SLAC1 family transporter n=1 Tax=Burkholderia sp. Ac-20345 TaxID=2703891 RepID=UPI00197B40C4|nr:hypothetical protein [Burkholderia sp. Ac-20345]MBN3779129.1 potassium-tellurite ethidium and proflavin transporter [Burkholderia sp. Ac-20345]
MANPRQVTIPASHFGMVLGLAGLGQAWRAAARLWTLPPLVGETILAVAGLTWAVLIAGYAWQAVRRFEQVQAECLHPVQGATPALVSAATSLVAMAIQPYSITSSFAIALVGANLVSAFLQNGFHSFKAGGQKHYEMLYDGDVMKP